MQDLHFKLRRRFSKSYFSFLKGFGQLTKVQLETMVLLAQGHDVLVHSPTASGKTEAALVPLCDKVFKQNKQSNEPGISLLYIVPTRALVNDIYRRISGPIKELELILKRKTGDHSEFKSRIGCDILITTPESFDSLLCRSPNVFKELSSLILDEIHLVDGTYRGDQLQMLIRRAKKISNQKIQMCALSATLPDPESVARRYIHHDKPDQVKTVSVKEKRDIKLELVESLEAAIDYCKKNNLKKILTFANSRKSVEALGKKLLEIYPKNRVLIHHGSLSKHVREEAELCMQQWTWGICVATTTLEIGIDIGDVDTVILAEVPTSPEAFQQRIGRGSRRSNNVSCVGIYGDELEKETYNYYEVLFYNPQDIENKITATYEFDASVCVQQILSIVYGAPRGVEVSVFKELFSTIRIKYQIEDILYKLENKKMIQFRQKKVFPSEELLNIGRRGFIHSNIPNSGEFVVVEMPQNKQLGKVSTQVTIGDEFVFLGRVWKVLEIKTNQLLVKRYSGNISKANFAKRKAHGAFQSWLP